ncbi:MAG TPA: hypothetical protein VF206_02750 [Rubrobacter sp.]
MRQQPADETEQPPYLYPDYVATRLRAPREPLISRGFGRSGAEDGEFSFVTLKPGPVPGPQGRLQAPHVMVRVFARGLLKSLVTRIYFPDESEANASDPLVY